MLEALTLQSSWSLVAVARTVGVGADGCIRNLRCGFEIFSTFSADTV